MDIVLWSLAVGGGLLLIAGLGLLLAPARTIILIDTPTSTARAEMRLCWGLGPVMHKYLLPQMAVASPLAAFGDAARVGNALMTPGIADVTYIAIQRVFALKPQAARFELHLNLNDPAQTRVVQTAVQAVLAIAPSPIQACVIIGRCEQPGAEIAAKFEMTASPRQITSIYNDLKGSRAGREFRRRLKRKPKPTKRPVREVRAS